MIGQRRTALGRGPAVRKRASEADRKSTRLNSSHLVISYAVFCLKKKKNTTHFRQSGPPPGRSEWLCVTSPCHVPDADSARRRRRLHFTSPRHLTDPQLPTDVFSH